MHVTEDGKKVGSVQHTGLRVEIERVARRSVDRSRRAQLIYSYVHFQSVLYF